MTGWGHGSSGLCLWPTYCLLANSAGPQREMKDLVMISKIGEDRN